MMHEDLTAVVGEVFRVKGFAELRCYLSFWDGTWKPHRTVNRFKLLGVRNDVAQFDKLGEHVFVDIPVGCVVAVSQQQPYELRTLEIDGAFRFVRDGNCFHYCWEFAPWRIAAAEGT